jgi:hypothetical protein
MPLQVGRSVFIEAFYKIRSAAAFQNGAGERRGMARKKLAAPEDSFHGF